MILPNRDNVKTVAVLHMQGGLCRVVVASRRAGAGAGGADSGSDLEIKAAETITLAPGGAGGGGAAGGAPAKALEGLVERVEGVDAVVRVLPPSCTVVRTCPLPTSSGSPTDISSVSPSGEALADALSIIAETDLPAAVPEYRRCAGMISPGRGLAAKPVGLLSAWPASAQLDAHSRLPRLAPEVCVSEAAALAVLARLVGGVDRGWTVDRSAGAMTILVVGPEKTLVRVARIPAGEPGADSRKSAVAETSRAAGLGAGAPQVSADSGWLTLEPAPSSARIGGQSRTPEWIGQYGLAAAAAAAFFDANPAVSALVSLHEAEPKAKPPILQRVSELLGAPKLAAALLVLCVVLCAAVPIGAAYAKLDILRKAVKDTTKLDTENGSDEKELAFYRLLHDRRWPMTKLLADIAGCCPQGIDVDSIELAQGDGVVVRGTADDTAKVTTFRANLNGSRIFADASTPSFNPTPDGVQFQLTAKVVPNGATYVAKPVEDWAASSLFDRMYPGQHASAPTRSTTSARPDRTDRTDRTDRSSRSDRRSTSGTRSSTSSRDSATRDRSSTTSSATKPLPIPAPLSDADIAKLTHDQAMLEWSTRKRVATQTSIDDAVKHRLLDESEKARARMLETGGGQ